MEQTGTHQVTPRLRATDTGMPARPWIDQFSSGYMQRVMYRSRSRVTASRGSTHRITRATKR